MVNKKKTCIALAVSGVTLLGSLGILRYSSMSEIEQEMKIFDSFDANAVLREERYHYANGIKVDVIYRKKEGKKSLLLKLLEDPRNLLIEGTPNHVSPLGSTYYIELDENNEIKFREIDTTLEYADPVLEKTIDASVRVRILRVKAGESYRTEIEAYGSKSLQGIINSEFDQVESLVYWKLPQLDQALSIDDLVKNLIGLEK